MDHLLGQTGTLDKALQNMQLPTSANKDTTGPNRDLAQRDARAMFLDPHVLLTNWTMCRTIMIEAHGNGIHPQAPRR
jgi:hypothetical protein